MSSKYQDCLNVLGLNETATKADIKAAFRKLALKCHPDKSQSQKSSIEEFQQVKDAYDFLMDAVDKNTNNMSDNLGDSVIWSKVFDILVTQINATMKRTQKEKHKENRRSKKCHHAQPPTAADPRYCVDNILNIKMRVTLDDLYHARVKKLLVKVKDVRTNSFDQEELYVSLFNYKETYIFKNKGDFLADGSRGNIHVTLEIEAHDLVHADKILCPYDLYIDMDISLSEYYCRNYMAISYFGEILELEDIKPGQKCMLVKGKGLPYFDSNTEEDTRGDLYVYLHLKLPFFEDNIVPADVKEVLSKHFVWKS